MISYAQNFEDVMLNRVFRDQETGFYIDVGAMDPTQDSVTRVFYDRGWSGINVEPNPFFYDKLIAERSRDLNLNLALGDSEAERDIHLFEKIGNSTFDEDSYQEYRERGFESTVKRVRVSTLEQICRDHVKGPIDFLKIDCEGWERFVIQGADWLAYQPVVVVVEATAPGTDRPSWSDWEPTLLAYYEMVYFDGLNRFYIRRDRSDLHKHFSVPPNVHDDFKSLEVVALTWARDELTMKLDALLARIAELEHSAWLESIKMAEITTALQAKEKEITEARAAMEAMHDEKSRLSVRLSEVQYEANEMRSQICRLDAKLVESRVWIGQLSQDLACLKQQR